MQETVWREDAAQAAGMKKRYVVAQQQSFTQIMADEDDGLLEPPLYLKKLLLNLHSAERVERAKGLVHQKDGWVRRQGTREANALPLSARKLIGITGSKFLTRQSNDFEHLSHPGADACGVPALQPGHN